SARLRRVVLPAAAAIRNAAVRDATARLRAARDRPSGTRILGLWAAGPEDELDGDRVDRRFVHRRVVRHPFDRRHCARHRGHEPDQADPRRWPWARDRRYRCRWSDAADQRDLDDHRPEELTMTSRDTERAQKT